MNFLNKKHVQTFANTHNNFGQNSNSKGFISSDEHSYTNNTGTYIGNRTQLNRMNRAKQSPKPIYPSGSNSRVVKQKQPSHPQQYSSYTQNFPIKKSPSTANIPQQHTNLCPQHENQVLRHLCLQCNELLCSQCISDHLQGHRQSTKTIPKIQTINKLRKQMNLKAEKILNFMQQNNPKVVLNDISWLKMEAVNKIQDMKAEVIKAFDEWAKILENHILEDLVHEEQLRSLSYEMEKIKEEVLILHSQVKNNPNASVQIVKKIHQIQSQKLEAAYLEMFNTFSKTILKSKFSFDFNWKLLMDSFEKSIIIKPLFVQTHQQVKQEEGAVEFNVKNIEAHENQFYQENQKYLKSIDIEEEKKFMQIHSIESLVQPLSHRGEPEKVVSHQNIEQQTQNTKVQRSFSRQNSGKRLPIFSASEEASKSNE